jgi:hypothetical protein
MMLVHASPFGNHGYTPFRILEHHITESDGNLADRLSQASDNIRARRCQAIVAEEWTKAAPSYRRRDNSSLPNN